MKKQSKLKKGLAILLSLAMVVGLMPGAGTMQVSATESEASGNVATAEGYDANGFCTSYELTNGTWALKDSATACATHGDTCNGYQPATLTTGTHEVDGDSDTQDEVYEITNAGQLYWFANKVNNENATYNNKNAVLTNDIKVNEGVLSGGALNTANESTFRSWTPIGYLANSTFYSYNGIFDGAGYTIKGLYVKESSKLRVGLFALNGGIIKKVNIADSYFSGKSMVGGICGQNYYGNIETCNNNSSIVSGTGDQVGGVCGWNIGTVINCENTGDVYGGEFVGGVCGDIGYNSYEASVKKCSNKGNVTGTGDQVGGVCGNLASGSLETSYNTGEVQGSSDVGGICGWQYGGSIDSCYNTGNVTSTGDHVGGVCGYQNGLISNCYSTGGVTSEKTGAKVGGVCGNQYSTIKNCYYDTGKFTGKAIHTSTTSSQTVYVEGKTSGWFSNGGVAYLLNSRAAEGSLVWYQNIDNDAEKDTIPVLDSSHGIVYASKPCETDFSNHDGKTKEHDYQGDKCSICGELAPPKPNGDGNYELKSVNNLIWFAELVKSNPSANAVLTSDITFDGENFTAIGSSDSPYEGTFDGAGHTVTVNQKDSKDVALFGCIGNCHIKNLTVTGTITTSQKYAAGIVMKVSKDKTATIEKCMSNVTIDSSIDGDGTHGGLVGVVDGTLNIDNSCFTGKMTGSTTNSCGGMVGYSSGSVTINNSYVAADFTGIDSTNGNTFARKNVTLVNCYYLNVMNATPEGAVSKTAEEFASGRVTLLLNDGMSEGLLGWYQNIDTGDKDSYPVVYDTHGRVYVASKPCMSKLSNDSAKSETIGHNYSDGKCTACGKTEGAYDDVTMIKPSKDSNGVYQIGSMGELYWFSALVNGELTDGTVQKKNADAVLTQDITINTKVLDDSGSLISNSTGLIQWVPIGNSKNYYCGTFDGKGHTISGLYFGKSDSSYIGLFGVSEGNIYNVRITDSYFTGNSCVSSVCGWNSGLISNCYNDGIVKDVSQNAGGLCGVNGYKGKGTIRNCYNAGSVTGKENVGGVCGETTNLVQCCYNTGTVSGTSYVYGVSRNNNGSIKESYYLENCNAEGTTFGDACSINLDKFKSGEVAYRLQGDQEEHYWGQTINNENYPVLGGAKVYATTGCAEYNNEGRTGRKEHSFDAHTLKCSFCGEYEAAVLTKDRYDLDGNGEKDEVYEIGSVGQLYWFANEVNEGNKSINAVLTKDIVVNEGDVAGCNGTKQEGWYDWTPMNGHKGIFDGNGHTVSGLYCNDGVQEFSGLFGNVENTVKNVGVINSYFDAKVIGGGVCGKIINGRIQNCYSTATVVSYNYAGGVCGSNHSSIIKNCYSTGKVSGSNHDSGGVCGYSSSGTITDCYFDSTIYNGSAVGAGSEGTTSNVLGKDTEAFKSGEVAYLLNGNTSVSEEGKPLVWYQNIDNGTADTHPVLDSTHGIVYVGNPCTAYTNNLVKEHRYDKSEDEKSHTCSDCNTTEQHADVAEFTADEDVNTITANCPVCGSLGTVTLTAANTTYDGTPKEAAIEGEIKGFDTPSIVYKEKSGDDFTVINSAPTDAGTYRASITYTVDADNSKVYTVSTEYTIARKPVTITADKMSMIYGETEPALSYKVSDDTPLVDGEVLSGELSREAGADAGTYKITQGTVTNDTNPNYDITFSEGTFTINKAQTEKTADCKMNLVYDESSQSYIATIEKVDNAEYSFDGSYWSNENICNGISPHNSVTGYIRIAGDKNHEPGTETSVNKTAGHGLLHCAAKAADCVNDGNIEYWHCVGCDNNYSDSEGNQSVGELVISKLEHLWSSDYAYDETSHWYNCKNANCPVTDNSKKEGFGYHSDSDNNGICDDCDKLIHSIVREVSATLDGDIGLNYYIALPESVTADTGAYVQFTVNGQDTKVLVNNLTAEADGTYKFTCWLTAKEMRDNVTFKLYDGSGTLIDIYSNSGDKVDGASFDYTLETYLNTLSSDENAALKYLADATLVYGAYAQNAFNHNAVPNLNGSELADVTLETLETNKMIKTGDIPEGLKLTEMTLILETETTLRLYFKSDNIENYTFKLDGTDVTLNTIAEEGLYYVEIANISAKDLDTKHTLIINDNCELTFNALSYAYATVKAGANDNICNVVKALYKYNDAANDYFGN